MNPLAAILLALPLAGSAIAAGPDGAAPPADAPGPAPAKAAVSYLDALRSRKTKSEWLGLTGISRFTGEQKRKELVRRIEALATTIDPKLPISVESTKISGNLAGVVLSQYAPLDPAGPRLFGVALVRREGRWLPTPSPGTFENTLYGYDPDQSRRAAEIERWLLHERATRTATIRERALETLRKRILARLPAEELKKLSQKEVVLRFIKACMARDIDAVLALTGGTMDPLPPDWSLRHAAVFKALNGTRDPIDRPWRLLAAPEVARALLLVEHQTRRSTIITLGCLDPAATNPSALASDSPVPPVPVPLELVRKKGGPWHINLPKFLLEPPRKRTRAFESTWIEKLLDDADPDLIGRFPGAFRKEHPPIPAPNPAKLRTLFLNALNKKDFPKMLRLTANHPDPLASLIGYERLATIWRSLHSPGKNGTAVYLGSLESPETTAFAINLFTAQQPEKAHVVVLRTLRNPDGTWSLAPRVMDIGTALAPENGKPDDGGSEHLDENPEPGSQQNADANAPKPTKTPPARLDPLAKRIAKALPGWEAGAPAASIAAAERLDALPSTPPPTPEQAASAVLEWREELLEGDIPGALRSAAVFNFKKSTSRFLRALAHEWIGLERSGALGKVVAAGTHGHWAAVTLRVEGPDGPSYPFYAVVSGKGPAKVLPEIDLFQNGNRTRRFLNKSTWRQLREEWPWPRETLDELEKLFERQKAALEKPASTGDGHKKS